MLSIPGSRRVQKLAHVKGWTSCGSSAGVPAAIEKLSRPNETWPDSFRFAGEPRLLDPKAEAAVSTWVPALPDHCLANGTLAGVI